VIAQQVLQRAIRPHRDALGTGIVVFCDRGNRLLPHSFVMSPDIERVDRAIDRRFHPLAIAIIKERRILEGRRRQTAPVRSPDR
jgi:hypothetical protein